MDALLFTIGFVGLVFLGARLLLRMPVSWTIWAVTVSCFVATFWVD
jgi:hypothetical protein